MMGGLVWQDDAWEYDVGYRHGRLPGNALVQNIVPGAALTGVAFGWAWIICAVLAGTGVGKITVPAAPAASDTYATLFDSRFALDLPSGAFAKGDRLQSADRPAALASQAAAPSAQTTPTAAYIPTTPPQVRRVVQSAPGATRRSSEIRVSQEAKPGSPADAPETQIPSNPPAGAPSFLERLFGKPSAAGVRLAYAAPDDGGLGGTSLPARYGEGAAVYDISAHTVYMPDGTKLEAHSGLGSRLDDPRYVAERNRGPTPPDIYELKMRGRPFHGVQALRLIPVDERKVFHRSGLLAHSYMLGANGASNGCVSFKDYDAFLQAYVNHQVDRLVVVTRLD
jgi:hypothetical protein